MFKKKKTACKHIDAFICEGVAISGDLYYDLSAVVDGDFRGNIFNGRLLTVGNKGHITGDIHVEHLIIAGRVNGNIKAKKRVDIKETAQIFGDIETPELHIAEGAVFSGRHSRPGRLFPETRSSLRSELAYKATH